MSKIIDLNEYRKKKNRPVPEVDTVSDDDLLSILVGMVTADLDNLSYPPMVDTKNEAEESAKKDYETYQDGDSCKCLFCGSIIKSNREVDEDA